MLAATASYAGECCPPGAYQAPCCSCNDSKGFGTFYSAWPNVCYPCPPTGWGGSIDISYLYWQAQEDGLDFAVKNNPLLTPSDNVYADMNGRLIGLDFKWEPAFKINASLLFPNGWDLDARWTCYYNRSSHSTASSAVVANTTSGLYPLWALPQSYVATPTLFGRAVASWSLHFNTIDLELGANPFLTPRLSLRVHGGLKGIAILQKYHVKYMEGITIGGITMLPSTSALKNNCYGLGPRVGFDSKWYLSKGWSIAADLAGSLTLNSFKMRRSDFDNAVGSENAFIEESKYKERIYSFRPNLEGLLGFAWDKCYGYRRQFTLGFLAAYELQIYWEQNLMPQLVSQQVAFLDFPSRGDLHLHGLTATLRLGF